MKAAALLTSREFRYAAITAICLLLVLYLVDFRMVASTVLSVRPGTLAYATLLILASAGLTLIRFRVVLGNFGFRPGWRDTFVAFAFGQASNLTFLNIVGQSISRAAVLAGANIPPGVAVVATWWERGLAAAVLFGFSLAGAWLLLADGGVEIDVTFSYLFYLFGSLLVVAALVAIAVLGWRDTAVYAVRWAGRGLHMWASVLLTVASQLLMLGAWLVMVGQISGAPLSLIVAGTVAMVMFASSLPISLSGWGVRELSAVQLLGAVGIGASAAASAAIAIGLIALSMVALFAVLGAWIFARRPTAAVGAAASAPVPQFPVAETDWTGLIAAFVAVATSLLIFFQVRVVIDGADLTANVSDVVALTALGLTAILIFQHRSYNLFPAGFSLALAAISALLLLALAIGWSRYGLTQWAVVNRGFGWIIILGYLGAGGALAWTARPNMRTLVLACFALTGTAVAMIELAFTIVSLLEIRFPANTFTFPLRGYAGNANAFALQMIATAIAAVTAHRLDPSLIGRKLLRVALAATVLAAVFSLSRSGMLTFLGVLLLMVLLETPRDRRKRLADALFPAGAIIAALVLPEILSAISEGLARLGLPVTFNPRIIAQMEFSLARDYSDTERWQSIADGLRLWTQYPLFGGGLGAFMQARNEAGLAPLVIHSIPVWMLAELGLVGLAIVLAGFGYLVRLAARLLRDPRLRPWGAGLLALLAAFAVMGLVHDFYYQRVFWFLIAIFVGVCAKPAVRHAPPPARVHA